MLLKSKVTKNGLAELRQEGSNYVLYLDGRVYKYSTDLNTIMREFDNLI